MFAFFLLCFLVPNGANEVWYGILYLLESLCSSTGHLQCYKFVKQTFSTFHMSFALNLIHVTYIQCRCVTHIVRAVLFKSVFVVYDINYMIRKLKQGKNNLEQDLNNRSLVFKEKAVLHLTTTTEIRLS